MEEAEFRSRLSAVREHIDPAVLVELRETHDAYDFGCSAHSEGLGCCLDWLVADGPELHQVSRVAAAARTDTAARPADRTVHYTDGTAEHCCLPGAWDWYAGLNARNYHEPLPDPVIQVAHGRGVDPHQLWDELEADGWEMHNDGLAEEAANRAAALTKGCSQPIPCPAWEEVNLQIQPWVPTLADLRQAGAAIMQPDGSYYVERDGQVVRMPGPQP